METLALRARGELREGTGREVSLAQVGPRESLESRDFLACMERRVREATRELLGRKDRLARVECPETMVLQDLQEFQEKWEPEGFLVREASPDCLDLQVSQEPRDPKVPRAMKDLSDLLDPLASLATRGLSARLAL